MRDGYRQTTTVTLSASGAALDPKPGLVLDGFAVMETAGAAGAWRMYAGTSTAGVKKYNFSLSANQSTGEENMNIPISEGLYIEEVSGTSTIELIVQWHVVVV